MRSTIRLKLMAGFSGLLVLMGVVGVMGGYAVWSLCCSEYQATHVGARLNSLALEIQVHNLEAARRVGIYLTETERGVAEKTRGMYLEQASFEIKEIQLLAEEAVAVAPTSQARAKFAKITEVSTKFERVLAKAVLAGRSGSNSKSARVAAAAYEDAADALHESVEDGEIAGQDASQASLEIVHRTSARSVALIVCIPLLGLALGSVASYQLSRAILAPVDHLKEVAESVSLGNLDIRVRRDSEDEIGDLADSFARMVTAVKFFQMEAEGGPASFIAHEVADERTV